MISVGINPGDGGLAILMPQIWDADTSGDFNYVQFVSYNYLTYPAQGGLRNMPPEIAFC